MIDHFPDLTLPPEAPVKAECYHNALNFITVNLRWRMVHGIVRQYATNVAMGHAWCEVTEGPVQWVYDPTSRILLPAPLYYVGGKISYTKVYEAHEVMRLAVRTGHSGPWDETVAQAGHHRRGRKQNKRELQKGLDKRSR